MKNKKYQNISFYFKKYKFIYFLIGVNYFKAILYWFCHSSTCIHRIELIIFTETNVAKTFIRQSTSFKNNFYFIWDQLNNPQINLKFKIFHTMKKINVFHLEIRSLTYAVRELNEQYMFDYFCLKKRFYLTYRKK